MSSGIPSFSALRVKPQTAGEGVSFLFTRRSAFSFYMLMICVVAVLFAFSIASSSSSIFAQSVPPYQGFFVLNFVLPILLAFRPLSIFLAFASLKPKVLAVCDLESSFGPFSNLF